MTGTDDTRSRMRMAHAIRRDIVYGYLPPVPASPSWNTSAVNR